MLQSLFRASVAALCMMQAGCSEPPEVRYATLVRFEGAPVAPSAELVRLLVIDLTGAEATAWTSKAGTDSPYERLRALGLALQRYKPDTVVVRGLPEGAAVGGAASAAELLAASAELYYRAEVPEGAHLCTGSWWDGGWWPRRCGLETMVASLRPVAVANGVVTLGRGAETVRVALDGDAAAPLGLQPNGEPAVDASHWRILRRAEDRFGGLLARPARFAEVARVARAGSGE